MRPWKASSCVCGGCHLWTGMFYWTLSMFSCVTSASPLLGAVRSKFLSLKSDPVSVFLSQESQQTKTVPLFYLLVVLGIELNIGLCTCVAWALGLERAAMTTYWRPGCDSRVCSYLSFKIPRNPPHEMGIRDEGTGSWRSQRCPRPPGWPAKSPFDFHVCCGHSYILQGPFRYIIWMGS